MPSLRHLNVRSSSRILAMTSPPTLMSLLMAARLMRNPSVGSIWSSPRMEINDVHSSLIPGGNVSSCDTPL